MDKLLRVMEEEMMGSGIACCLSAWWPYLAVLVLT